MLLRHLTLTLAIAAAFMVLAFGSSHAFAASRLVIEDPTTLKFTVQDNRVYLRNLNDYDAAWLPCCINYYIDLSTDYGRAMFSTILSFRLAKQRVVLFKDDPSVAGPIAIVGDF